MDVSGLSDHRGGCQMVLRRSPVFLTWPTFGGSNIVWANSHYFVVEKLSLILIGHLKPVLPALDGKACVCVCVLMVCVCVCVCINGVCVCMY